MDGPERAKQENYEQMTTAALEDLLRRDFRARDAGDGGMDELLRAAEELARREPPSGDADRAWTELQERYLPFHGTGESLYEDPEPPAGSDAAAQPRRYPGSADIRRPRPRRYPMGHLAAGLLLAVLLSGALVLASSREARAAFTGWVREICGGDSVVYQYDGVEEGPAGGEEQSFYAPAWVPERFQLTDVADVDGLLLAYTDGEGRSMTLYCLRTDSGTLSIFDTEPLEREVRGKKADFYPAREEGYASALIWEDGEKLFWLTGVLTEEEIFRVAESVQPMPPQLPPCRPAWFPEGYEELTSSSGTSKIAAVRRNEEGQTISFSCAWGSEAEALREEIEAASAGLTPEEVRAGEYSAQFCRGEDGTNHLVWSDGGGRVYWLCGSVDSQVLIQIAESVP